VPADDLLLPTQSNLHIAVEGAPYVEAASCLLLEPFRAALLVRPEIDRLAQDAAMRLNEEATVGEEPVILGRSLGEKPRRRSPRSSEPKPPRF